MVDTEPKVERATIVYCTCCYAGGVQRALCPMAKSRRRTSSGANGSGGRGARRGLMRGDARQSHRPPLHANVSPSSRRRTRRSLRNTHYWHCGCERAFSFTSTYRTINSKWKCLIKWATRQIFPVQCSVKLGGFAHQRRISTWFLRISVPAAVYICTILFKM